MAVVQRKDMFLRCRSDEFVIQDWPSMQRHLAEEHSLDLRSENAAKLGGHVSVVRSAEPRTLRKLKRDRGAALVKSSRGNGRVTVSLNKPSVTMQEVIVPVYVRIPIAIGGVHVIGLAEEKENGK